MYPRPSTSEGPRPSLSAPRALPQAPQDPRRSRSGSCQQQEAAAFSPSSVGHSDQFLAQATDIEISREDRQEGYDLKLLELQPRTGGKSFECPPQARDQLDIPPPLPSGASDTARRLSSRPISFDHGAASGGGGGAGGKLSEVTATNTKESQGTLTRSAIESLNASEKESDVGHRKRHSSGGERHGRRKKKRSKATAWLDKKLFWGIGIAFVLLVIASVGLGVGLTAGKSNKSSSDSGVNSVSPSSVPVPSDVSQNAGGVVSSDKPAVSSESLQPFSGSPFEPATVSAESVSVSATPRRATSSGPQASSDLNSRQRRRSGRNLGRWHSLA
ncbi:hypothetical protein T439DRAFT_353948 [Meredithblackwellia eburnea MCA 4105]